MGNVVIVLHDDGIQELLKSDGVMAELKAHARTVQSSARTVQSSAGDGYAISEHIGKTRGNVSVYASTAEAYKDNLQNNTLLKAVSK